MVVEETAETPLELPASGFAPLDARTFGDTQIVLLRSRTEPNEKRPGAGPGLSKSSRRDKPYGSITVLITWITPFDWMTFGIVTVAASTLRVDDDDVATLLLGGQRLALDGLELGLATASLDLLLELLGSQLAGNDVVGQHGGELRLVLGLQQVVDGAGREAS